MFEFSQTIPASTAWEKLWARLRSLVQMYAARPYFTPLASWSASSSVSNGVMATTGGPKISSWKIRASGFTSANTVGGHEVARLEALGGRPPPATNRASRRPTWM